MRTSALSLLVATAAAQYVRSNPENGSIEAEMVSEVARVLVRTKLQLDHAGSSRRHFADILLR